MTSPTPAGAVDVAGLMEEAQEAYDKVSFWPERNGDVGIVQHQGFMDLLSLRNLVPSLLSALKAAGEERKKDDWDRKAEETIAEAARLIKPGEGETVFYLRVGGSHSQLTVKASKGVDPAAALDAAIQALQAERGDLANCPVHAAAESRATALAQEVERLREALGEIASKNDLSSFPDDEVEAAARGALYDCELIARAALSPQPEEK